VISGVDMLDRHDSFERDRTNGALASEGAGAETRTNILIAVTGALVLTTVVIGAFFTEWNRPTRSVLAHAF
jgi:hypothetical protein